MNATEYARRVAALEAEGLTTSDAQGVVDADILNTKGTMDMTASTTTRSTAVIRGEIRGLVAERDRLERTHKATGTRRRTAETKRDYYPQDDASMAKIVATIARHEAKEAELATAIADVSARIQTLNREAAVAQEAERDAWRAQREAQRADVETAITLVIDKLQDGAIVALAKQHDLDIRPTGEGVVVGWDEPYTGNDGRQYVDRNRVSVELPHTWHGDREVGPAKVNWSAMGATEPAKATRYAAAMTVAAAIAVALTNAGIVDTSWNMT